MGNSVLNAWLGGKKITKTNVTRVTSAAKAATRAAQERGDVGQAAGSLESLRQEFDKLQNNLEQEIQKLDAALRPEALVLESTPIRPKKTDIAIERVVLAWTPQESTAS